YLDLFKGNLKAKRFVEIRIQGVFLNGRFLLLEAFVALQQGDFHIRIWRNGGVDAPWMVLGFQDHDSQFPCSGDIAQGEADVAQFILL
ncbi:hypothetical protein EGW08_010211, partial [Elysia chlorotica]